MTVSDTDSASAGLPDRGPGVALIGYRGTGKSEVGRLLAERLGRPFVDADEALEARLGRTIRDLFANQGEPVFRDEEETTLRELTRDRNLVLATGGGVILRAANRRRLRAFGTVIWLQAAPEEIARRLQSDREGLDQRPALTSAGTLNEIHEVLARREPLYRETADLAIDTNQRTPRQVVEAILATLAENAR